MNSQVVIQPVSLHTDPRGAVFEPLGPEGLAAQRNVHVALTEPGCVRGNHYHERGTEVAVVMGPALVRLRENGALRDVLVPAGTAFRFSIPPGVSHAFQNTGPGIQFLVGFNTVAHDPAHPDVVRDVLIPA